MRSKILPALRLSALVVVLIWMIGCVLILVAGFNDRPQSADVGVVPGSKVYPSGNPSPSLRARLDEALIVWRRGLVKNLFVSGGVGKEGFDESQVMRAYLIAHGVPTTAIVTDSHGDNTFATARHAAALMRERHWASAFVVSQYFHVPRTRLALTACGVKVSGWAHAREFELRDFYSVPREALGYPAYAFERC